MSFFFALAGVLLLVLAAVVRNSSLPAPPPPRAGTDASSSSSPTSSPAAAAAAKKKEQKGGSTDDAADAQPTSAADKPKTTAPSASASASAADGDGDGDSKTEGGEAEDDGRPTRAIRVLYGTQRGTAAQWAQTAGAEIGKHLNTALDREHAAAQQKRAQKKKATAAAAAAAAAGDADNAVPRVAVEVADLASFEAEELSFEAGNCIVFVVATYEGGTPPDSARPFFKDLEDLAQDFRVHKSLLSGVRYAILGIGDSVYDDRWNSAAKSLDMLMQCLSAQRVGDVCLADCGAGAEIETAYRQWVPEVVSGLKRAFVQRPRRTVGSSATVGKRRRRRAGASDSSAAAAAAAADGEEVLSADEDSADEAPEATVGQAPLKDLEDLGAPSRGEVGAAAAAAAGKEGSGSGESPAMVTPSLEKALTKQGYRIIGSHSGVKLCRWTKSMLRGRGGCYKHTFYGIQSHQCAEVTPSLACANKCVFCWRHYSNPVGREWRWKTDAPEFIVDGALEQHVQMVKQLRGMPGVKASRLAEGMDPRHMALSLVGEPVMYPFINRFVQYLHEKKISSFMVTNAQFPEQQRKLGPVTQMYVSVDASNAKNLQAVDRPIFKDFWQRFLECIDILRDTGQRTVFRLTLVKGWNDGTEDDDDEEEVEGAGEKGGESSKVEDAGEGEEAGDESSPAPAADSAAVGTADAGEEKQEEEKEEGTTAAAGDAVAADARRMADEAAAAAVAGEAGVSGLGPDRDEFGRPTARVQLTPAQERQSAKIIGEYAALAKRGEPGLIEIKGVTFCGGDGASSLTMQNVPFHDEVVKFARDLCAHPLMEGKYGVACEHEHSCCVLVARKDPFYDSERRRWMTWIDYPKFHQLVADGKPFTAADYMLETPTWALSGATERGFDPEETRYIRNRPYQGPGC